MNAYSRTYYKANRERLNTHHTRYRNSNQEYRQRDIDRKRRKGKADE